MPVGSRKHPAASALERILRPFTISARARFACSITASTLPLDATLWAMLNAVEMRPLSAITVAWLRFFVMRSNSALTRGRRRRASGAATSYALP